MNFLLDYYGTQGGQTDLPPMEHVEATKHIEVLNIYRNVNESKFYLETVHLDADAFRRSQSADEHRPGSVLVIQVALVQLLVDFEPYHLSISRACFDAMMTSFDLLKVQRMALSSVMTFDLHLRNITDSKEGLDCSMFMVHYFGLYAHYSTKQRSTKAVLWCAKPGLVRLKTAIEGLIDLSEHPLFLLLVTNVALTAIQNQRLAQLSYFISTVERRTGHHGDFAVAHPKAGEALDRLSARMSGTASAIAANRRLNDLLNMVLKKMADPQYSQDLSPSECTEAMHNKVNAIRKFLQDRVDIHSISIDLLEARAKNQLNAIFNMLAQNDMKLSLLIARDSHKIASAAKRDSTSMKILAAVTVFFLPATFIASLFSSSMFHWQIAAESTVSSQLWIYWAVALPLTAITCTICYSLSYYWASINKMHDEEAEKAISTAFS